MVCAHFIGNHCHLCHSAKRAAATCIMPRIRKSHSHLGTCTFAFALVEIEVCGVAIMRRVCANFMLITIDIAYYYMTLTPIRVWFLRYRGVCVCS